MANDVSIEVAKLRVQDFVSKEEQLLADHHEAMECRDCEDLLDAGIQALAFVRSAEMILTEAARRGVAPVETPIVEAIRILYESWLRPCASAERWITELAGTGHAPNNLAEFRQAKAFATLANSRNAILASVDEPFFDDDEVERGGVAPSNLWPSPTIPLQRLPERT
jgi:hypothetical protein